MKERIHEQISKELKLATRLDLVTVIVGVVVTLTLFFIAMGFAFGAVGSISTGGLAGAMGIPRIATTFNTTPTIVMFVILIVIGVINWFAVKVLLKNKAQRAKQNEGLMKLYKDEGMDQYYDGSIFKSYETRYNLFAIIMSSIAAMGIIVPLAIFIDRLTKL